MKDKCVKQLKFMNLPNVYITTGLLSAYEYQQMLLSADIGLALYRSLQTGYHIMGRTHP
jgi:hypothetical protein